MREYVDATVPEMAFGEYWDTCSYTGELPCSLQGCVGGRRRCVQGAAAAGQGRARRRRAGLGCRACRPDQPAKPSHPHQTSLHIADGVLAYNQDSHRQRTVDWCDATGGTAAAFDFTLKARLGGGSCVFGGWCGGWCCGRR